MGFRIMGFREFRDVGELGLERSGADGLRVP